MASHEQVQDQLRRVIDPELRKDVVSLGMVRAIEFPAPGRVDVMISLTTPGCPIRSHFEQAVRQTVSELPDVQDKVDDWGKQNKDKLGVPKNMLKLDPRSTSPQRLAAELYTLTTGKDPQWSLVGNYQD